MNDGLVMLVFESLKYFGLIPAFATTARKYNKSWDFSHKVQVALQLCDSLKPFDWKSASAETTHLWRMHVCFYIWQPRLCSHPRTTVAAVSLGALDCKRSTSCRKVLDMEGRDDNLP